MQGGSNTFGHSLGTLFRLYRAWQVLPSFSIRQLNGDTLDA